MGIFTVDIVRPTHSTRGCSLLTANLTNILNTLTSILVVRNQVIEAIILPLPSKWQQVVGSETVPL